MASDDNNVPKYKRKGFLQKQYALYYGARISTRTAQRYGNDDGPIAPIEPIEAVKAAHPASDEIDPLDINDI